MGLNFERVWAALMESRESQRESRLEMERLMKESNEKAEREMRESRLEMERLMKESNEKAEREMGELRESLRETARVVRETSNSIGGLNNRFGELAEHLVAPNIEEKFNALGYHFKTLIPNQRIKNEKGEIIAEIDILLENKEYVVAVEVKSKPKIADIADFARRLEVLRKDNDGHNDRRKIRGAIAGAVFQENVKKAVLKAGFYVIEQTGDTMEINVPENFKPKEW
jgi:hypothetical protein